MEIHGLPIIGFVDSGAQMTVMSKTSAEQCNLYRLIDQMFSGVVILHITHYLCTIKMSQLEILY